jgi:hypothetical protein
VSEGLARAENGKITTFGAQQGLPHDHINSIAEDSAGAPRIGTDDGRLVHFEGSFPAAFEVEEESVPFFTVRDGG